MARNEFRRDDYQDIDCFFCKQLLVFGSNADLDVLHVAEMACWMEGHIADLDDMHCGFDSHGDFVSSSSVCPACAERLVGPDWREKGQAVIVKNEGWRSSLAAANIRDESDCLAVIH